MGNSEKVGLETVKLDNTQVRNGYCTTIECVCLSRNTHNIGVRGSRNASYRGVSGGRNGIYESVSGISGSKNAPYTGVTGCGNAPYIQKVSMRVRMLLTSVLVEQKKNPIFSNCNLIFNHFERSDLNL